MDQNTIIWINAIFLATNLLLFYFSIGGHFAVKALYQVNAEAAKALNAQFERLGTLADEYKDAAAILKAHAENLNRSLQLPQLNQIPLGYKVEMTPDGLRIHHGTESS